MSGLAPGASTPRCSPLIPVRSVDLSPDLDYMARLERRNEYLIASHHPLRETLMAQTGDDTSGRHGFLQAMYEVSASHQVAVWKAPLAGDPSF